MQEQNKKNAYKINNKLNINPLKETLNREKREGLYCNKCNRGEDRNKKRIVNTNRTYKHRFEEYCDRNQRTRMCKVATPSLKILAFKPLEILCV